MAGKAGTPVNRAPPALGTGSIGFIRSTNSGAHLAAIPFPAQSRSGSIVEAFANVALGYVLAILIQQALFPLVGIQLSLTAHVAVAACFTIVSLVRSYLLRRLFEYIAGLRLQQERGRVLRLQRLFQSGVR